jgi:hypothetical protein
MALGKKSLLSIGVLTGLFIGIALAMVGFVYMVYSDEEADETIDPAQFAQYADGELEVLPASLRTGCGVYFASAGDFFLFVLKLKIDKDGSITDFRYVAERKMMKFVLNDSVPTPKAKLMDLPDGNRGVEVSLSSTDFQRASCLSKNGI